MKISSLNGEKVFKEAVKVIKEEMPEEKCKWCGNLDERR